MKIKTFKTFHEAFTPPSHPVNPNVIELSNQMFALFGTYTNEGFGLSHVLNPEEFHVLPDDWGFKVKNDDYEEAVIDLLNDKIIPQYVLNDLLNLDLGIVSVEADTFETLGATRLSCKLHMEEGWFDLVLDAFDSTRPQPFAAYVEEQMNIARNVASRFTRTREKLRNFLVNGNEGERDHVIGLLLGYLLGKQPSQWGRQAVAVLRASLDFKDFYDGDPDAPHSDDDDDTDEPLDWERSLDDDTL